MCGLRTCHSTDLSDPEREIPCPPVPAVKPGGRPAKHTRREILNALAYWLRAGCAWRLLPHDLPPWQTVYHYWRRWQQEGVWERMLTVLRERERVRLGRDPTPSAAIIDSQNVRASERGGLHGYDGGKKVSGIKRHLLVDTRGTVTATICYVLLNANYSTFNNSQEKIHQDGRLAKRATAYSSATAVPIERIYIDCLYTFDLLIGKACSMSGLMKNRDRRFLARRN